MLLDSLNIDEDCKGVKELPVLTFVLDGVHYDLDANDYVMKIDANGNEVFYFLNFFIKIVTILNISFI